MPARATEQPKAVAGGGETILLDHASITRRVVSTPTQKSSRCHRPATLLPNDEAMVVSAPCAKVPTGDRSPLKWEGGDAWLATRESASLPPGAADACPFAFHLSAW